jgi:2-polyprenyl-3-methyl-5-hydroxy-6-metoxy-1,4-benzoquinol methylase
MASAQIFRTLARRVRAALLKPRTAIGLLLQDRIHGRFQFHGHTAPDRYPWLFEFAKSCCSSTAHFQILSFGCSRGDEVFSLRRYFPAAAIKGIDVNPANISICLARAQAASSTDIAFVTAASTQSEPAEFYDAIFCLAVLCLSELTVLGARRCDPWLKFEDFERIVTDLARCLKPGGLLLLHTTNFRFCDTAISGSFDVLLEVEPQHLTQEVKYDRSNELMEGEVYRPVAFRKRATSVRLE